MTSKDAGQFPEDVAAAISVLGDQTNSAIIKYLIEYRQATLGMLLKHTGAQRYALSRRLTVLEDADVVVVDEPRGERTGKVLVYRLNTSRLNQLYTAWRNYVLEDIEGLT
ncbi:ArsR/SmtB family transcription factor [Leifsonia aquatica]|uniref:ArsR/SmtB family transcription factor n=1 Tax=Leifsonia aquatica TaxID=144185 RepID=UPI00384DEB8F